MCGCRFVGESGMYVSVLQLITLPSQRCQASYLFPDPQVSTTKMEIVTPGPGGWGGVGGGCHNG